MELQNHNCLLSADKVMSLVLCNNVTKAANSLRMKEQEAAMDKFILQGGKYHCPEASEIRYKIWEKYQELEQDTISIPEIWVMRLWKRLQFTISKEGIKGDYRLQLIEELHVEALLHNKEFEYYTVLVSLRDYLEKHEIVYSLY